MKILFYFGHPSQYLFLRESIARLSRLGNQVIIVIKTKDVLEKLVSLDGHSYINILPNVRGTTQIDILASLLIRNIRILRILIKSKPDLLVGTDASIAQMGWLLSRNRITTTEDDYDVIKNLAKLTYPFTQTILCPKVCKVGKWAKKKIGYDGYMKLGYLHPNIFFPDKSIVERMNLPKKFVLIRLAKLTAHHDFGIIGISIPILDKIISKIEAGNLNVLISSESPMNEKYAQYLIRCKPNEIHQILNNANILISDSQSMSVEASILGIPSIRYSSFKGRISVLEELEHNYMLTFGIDPNNPKELFSKLDELMINSDLKTIFKSRRDKMLEDKIDVSAFLVWFIHNYPESVRILNDNPEYQKRFK